MTKTTQQERDDLRSDPHPQPEDVRRVCDDADRLAAIEREIKRQRESYTVRRDFLDTDTVARFCYQGFVNALDDLRAIIDAPDAGGEE